MKRQAECQPADLSATVGRIP